MGNRPLCLVAFPHSELSGWLDIESHREEVTWYGVWVARHREEVTRYGLEPSPCMDFYTYTICKID